MMISVFNPYTAIRMSHLTMWSCDLAPDYSNLCAPDLLVCAVDECDLLAQIESNGIVNG